MAVASLPSVASATPGARVSGLTGDARPIGVFDSGIGGLSVLGALRTELPHERFVYYADAAHAPYGERDDAHVTARTNAIAHQLVHGHGVKALVVACNTATAAAIHLLRAALPGMPIVGVEPALRPAVAASRTGHVGVMATRGTLQSAKFAALHASLAGQARFSMVACDGLAHAIERGDGAAISALAARYVAAVGRCGGGAGEIDTVVLGCTHYPLVIDVLRQHTGAAMRFFETGPPVAQQTRRLLDAGGLLAAVPPACGRDVAGPVDIVDAPALTLASSGNVAALRQAAARWLQPATSPSCAPGGNA